MKKIVIVLALMATLLTGLMRPANAIFDKTRFALDLGVAFFAFHHWVYTPYQQGAFASGAPHRTKALLKGGAALLFAVNRVERANHIAHTSNSPMLQKLAGSLDVMQSKFTNLGQKLKSGRFDARDVDGLNSTVNSVGSGAEAAGAKVKDVPIAIPGS